MKEHVVKCWPEYFDAIEAGLKPFDVRFNDRDYVQCDVLVLERYDPINGYTDPHKELRRIISWVLPGGQFGIEPGYAVLGLANFPPSPPSDRDAIVEADNAELFERMLDALKAAERADKKHSNCEDCMETGQSAEVCEECFPSADDARVLRRNVLAEIKKATRALSSATEKE
jgi:hypothetical protein